jgi:hypothetical protein
MVDYPNSLARAYILDNHTEYHVDRYFAKSPMPWPYLAMDGVVVPLQAISDVEVTGKIFSTAIVLLFAVGCHQMGRRIHAGRPGWPHVAACS